MLRYSHCTIATSLVQACVMPSTAASPGLQVPNTLSICGAVLICSCTFLLGVFTRKKEPAGTAQSAEASSAVAEADPAAAEGDRLAAEREEIESLLGHKSVSNGV